MKKIPTVNDYEVRIWYSPREGDECFLAQVLGWPSLMAHGDTHEEAAYEIRQALTFALEVSLKYGNPIPEPKRAEQGAAAVLGSLGGRTMTPARLAACRANAQKAGRPKGSKSRPKAARLALAA